MPLVPIRSGDRTIATFDPEVLNDNMRTLGPNGAMLFNINDQWVLLDWKPSNTKGVNFPDAKLLTVDQAIQWCDANQLPCPYDLLETLAEIGAQSKEIALPEGVQASVDIIAGREHVRQKLNQLRARVDFSKLQPQLEKWIDDAIPLILEGRRVADQDLESWGFPRVEGDIDKLYELARMTGRNADPMTYREVVDWAIELKREATIRRQVEIDSGTPNEIQPIVSSASNPKSCWICSCRIDTGNVCDECQRRKGKMVALEIAINQNNTECIEEWPQLRATLKSKFGFDRDVHELWENMIDWLWINHRLDENDVINLRIVEVPKLLHSVGNKENDSAETKAQTEIGGTETKGVSLYDLAFAIYEDDELAKKNVRAWQGQAIWLSMKPTRIGKTRPTAARRSTNCPNCSRF